MGWLIVIWRRLHQLLRFFQLEGYDSRRYLRWFFRQRHERNLLIGSLIGTVLPCICTVATIWYADTWIEPGNLGSGIIPAFIIFYGLPLFLFGLTITSILLTLNSLLDNRQSKQQFTLTSRATRLLISVILIVIVFAVGICSLFRLFLLPDKIDISADFLFVTLPLAVVGGPIALFTAPFSFPLANAINWPIEEAFRQYYLSRARRFLKRSGATVIAITGSYGKTSTKHYLHHILEGRFRVLMTPKSYNTLLGISRVINDVLAKDVSYEYFIVETDAYFVGENARICKLVQPQMGMIMTVGPMHLERLGSMENIEKAQYEVIEALPPDGAGFFNGDDPAVRQMAGRGYPQTTIMVTKEGMPGARLEALNVRMTAEGLDFDVRDNQTDESRSMHAPLYGDHNVTNILMAAAVAHYLGMSLAEIGMRVTTLEPAEHRLIRRVMPDGIILIDDTYSANPVGTQTALGVLALHTSSPHRVVVSSGMFELGAVSDEENCKLGERIAAAATDVILIGATQTKAVKEGLVSCNFPPDHLHVVNTLNEAVEIYKGILRPGDTLLMLTDLPDTYA